MMRRLIGLGVVFGLLWSGWWCFASWSLQTGVNQWFAERRTEGWQAELTDIRVAGFPTSLQATLVAPVLADPQTGVAFEASQLMISAPAWWPGYATVSFPEDELHFATPTERRTVIAQGAKADLRLRPGSAFELEEMALTSGAWSLSAPQGSVMAAQGLTLRMKQSENDATQYIFTLDAPAFRPGSMPRQTLRIPADWPVAFDSLAVDATVGFDRAFDRSTIEVARPQPRRVDLHLAEAVWGTLLLRKAAELDVDDQGVLNGEVTLQARGWQEMLTLAETAGILPSTLRPQAENIMGALARGSGSPDAIDVTIALRDGTMFLGFIPLGSAPLLLLR